MNFFSSVEDFSKVFNTPFLEVKFPYLIQSIFYTATIMIDQVRVGTNNRNETTSYPDTGVIRHRVLSF